MDSSDFAYQAVSTTPWLEVVSEAEVTEGAAGIFVTKATFCLLQASFGT
jgi:hypothetical protein